MTWCLVALAVAAQDPIVLFALNPTDADVVILKDVFDDVGVQGRSRIPSRRAFVRLTGIDNPRTPEPNTLGSMLSQADELEARFDSQGANALRNEVVRSYDLAFKIDPELLRFAAQATQDRAITAYIEREGAQDLKRAEELAVESERRFPNFALDAGRHKPAVREWFDQASQGARSLPASELTVSSRVPGTLHADGRKLGDLDKKISVKLPEGSYRIWVKTEDGESLAHKVQLAAARPSQIRIDADLESRLSMSPIPALRCESEDACTEYLQRLARITDATHALGVQVRPSGVIDAVFVDQSGTATYSQLENVTALTQIPEPQPADDFSLWYLAPFGVGQMAQDRYVTGSIYGAVQLGLLSWNLIATQQRNDAADDDPDLDSLSDRQNLSAGLFYGSVAAAILESVLVWSLSD